MGLGLIALLLRLVERHDPPVMLGVLQIVLGCDAVAGRVGVARHLQIFLIDVRSGAANLDLRTRRIERAIWIDVVALRPAAASTRAFHLIPVFPIPLCTSISTVLCITSTAAPIGTSVKKAREVAQNASFALHAHGAMLVIAPTAPAARHTPSNPASADFHALPLSKGKVAGRRLISN